MNISSLSLPVDHVPILQHLTLGQRAALAVFLIGVVPLVVLGVMTQLFVRDDLDDRTQQMLASTSHKAAAQLTDILDLQQNLVRFVLSDAQVQQSVQSTFRVNTPHAALAGAASNLIDRIPRMTAIRLVRDETALATIGDWPDGMRSAPFINAVSSNGAEPRRLRIRLMDGAILAESIVPVSLSDTASGELRVLTQLDRLENFFRAHAHGGGHVKLAVRNDQGMAMEANPSRIVTFKSWLASFPEREVLHAHAHLENYNLIVETAIGAPVARGDVVRFMFLTTVCCVVVMVIIIALYLHYRFVRPIRRINALFGTSENISSAPAHDLVTLANNVQITLDQLRGVTEHQGRRIKRLHNRVRDAVRLQSAGTIASSAAHDIASPLQTLRMCAEELEEYPVGSDERELGSLIHVSISRIADITTRMRALAKSATDSELVDIRLAHLVSRVHELMAPRMEAGSVIFESKIDPELIIKARKDSVEEALVNLLGNACTAVEERSERRIRVDTDTSCDGKLVGITIIDSGPGFRGDDVERLEQGYFGMDGSAAGLGIYISQKIAKDHGGKLEIDPQASGGADHDVVVPTGFSCVNADIVRYLWEDACVRRPRFQERSPRTPEDLWEGVHAMANMVGCDPNTEFVRLGMAWFCAFIEQLDLNVINRDCLHSVLASWQHENPLVTNVAPVSRQSSNPADIFVGVRHQYAFAPLIQGFLLSAAATLNGAHGLSSVVGNDGRAAAFTLTPLTSRESIPGAWFLALGDHIDATCGAGTWRRYLEYADWSKRSDYLYFGEYPLAEFSVCFDHARQLRIMPKHKLARIVGSRLFERIMASIDEPLVKGSANLESFLLALSDAMSDFDTICRPQGHHRDSTLLVRRQRNDPENLVISYLGPREYGGVSAGMLISGIQRHNAKHRIRAMRTLSTRSFEITVTESAR